MTTANDGRVPEHYKAGYIGDNYKRLRRDWRNHRMDAARRGIAFELTFDAWLDVWESSGHLPERGCRKGEYVMARFGDKGPYAVSNVRIVPVEVNHAEAWSRSEQRSAYKQRMMGNTYRVGARLTDEHKAAVSRAAKGRIPHNKGQLASVETRLKLSRALQGNTNTLGHTASEETRAKMSAAQRGRQHTAESIAKMVTARKRYWAKRHQRELEA